MFSYPCADYLGKYRVCTCRLVVLVASQLNTLVVLDLGIAPGKIPVNCAYCLPQHLLSRFAWKLGCDIAAPPRMSPVQAT